MQHRAENPCAGFSEGVSRYSRSGQAVGCPSMPVDEEGPHPMAVGHSHGHSHNCMVGFCSLLQDETLPSQKERDEKVCFPRATRCQQCPGDDPADSKPTRLPLWRRQKHLCYSDRVNGKETWSSTSVSFQQSVCR